jgi:DNA replication protein DnaC
MQRSTAGGTYQSRPRALPEPQNARIRPVPTQQQERPTQSLSRYHYTDDYTPALPADVIEDWEEEDDATSIRYGDWEEEEQDEGEVVVYQRTDIDAIPQPRRPYTYSGNMTRDFSHPDDAEEQARITRNLRDLRMPVAMQPASAQSIPQALTREMQRYHRTTQPLNPQVVVEMNREHEQEMRQPVKPVRAVASREQGKQQELHYVSAAPATTPPMAPKSVCPRCKGAGYLRVDVPFGHPNFGKPTPCSCKDNEKKEKRRQQLREMSNLDAFYDKTFRTFNARVPGVQEAYQVSADYAQNPAGWLLLVGPNGCGKTHLAAAIANQGLEDGAVVLFAVVPDLLDHLRAAFAPTATEVYDQLFAKMREAELLVLDDLGSQQSSPWANEKLFQLLNYRYNMGMPTVITANPRGLQGIDERIRSRLSDVSLVIAVHLDRARDYRPNHPRRD